VPMVMALEMERELPVYKDRKGLLSRQDTLLLLRA
jgi:hypothetical protein